MLALLAGVILVDQLAKWWAWRHAPLVKINYGGNVFVGDTISQWYADPATGALLDLIDFGVLTAAALVLIRRRLPALILVPGALMVGGWIATGPQPSPVPRRQGTTGVGHGCRGSLPPPALSLSSGSARSTTAGSPLRLVEDGRMGRHGSPRPALLRSMAIMWSFRREWRLTSPPYPVALPLCAVLSVPARLLGRRL